MTEFRYIWDNLRDASFPDTKIVAIQADLDAWKHFILDSGHMQLFSSVFEEWLGKSLCADLKEAWSGKFSSEQREKLLGDAGGKMSDGIRRCVNAPFLLVYHEYGINGGDRGECWLLPLQIGIRLIVKRMANKNMTLATCFPPDMTSRALFPTHRWLIEATRCIEMYADVCPQTGDYLLPSKSKRVPRKSGKTKVFDCQIRFCKPNIWGFENDNAGARWQPVAAYPKEFSDKETRQK